MYESFQKLTIRRI